MLDCWMAWTERYTIEIAEMMASERVYWMEECLQPHDYEGFGRLECRDQIHSHRNRRTRVHALRLPQTAGAQRRRDLAARYPLVRWNYGIATHRGAGSGLRHPGDSARRRPVRLYSTSSWRPPTPPGPSYSCLRREGRPKYTRDTKRTTRSREVPRAFIRGLRSAPDLVGTSKWFPKIALCAELAT